MTLASSLKQRLAALGHWREVTKHVCRTTKAKTSREDVHEAQPHVAIYAGVSSHNHAIEVAKRTDFEMGVAGGHDKAGEQMICNSRPETGAIYTRGQTSLPAAYSSEYKSYGLRSLQRNRLSFWNAITEITGPMFGNGLNSDLDSDLTVNYAVPGESVGNERIIIEGGVLDDHAEPHAADPFLNKTEQPIRRASLVAKRNGSTSNFDSHLKGAHETVYFDI